MLRILTFTCPTGILALTYALLAFGLMAPDSPAAAQNKAKKEAGEDAIQQPPKKIVVKEKPFKDLSGWWSGKGHLSIKDEPTSPVKCRVTYFVSDDGQNLTQNLRCSTPDTNIEVKSELEHKDGKITGTWREEKYNLNGDVSGHVDEDGLIISVKGADLTADMNIITKLPRQIVEIEFTGQDLQGFTIILKKG